MESVSVIMAAHNAAPTIGLSIRSVLRALPADGELLVWDDGSTDATREVVAMVPDSRVRLFGSTESVGSGVARRELVRRSSHDLVAVNDADDVCLPWRFTRIRRRLRHADFLCTSAVRFGSAERPRPAAVLPLRSRDIPVALLVHNPIVHSSVIGWKQAFESIGSYSDLRRGQDYELWLRAAAAGLRFTHSLVPTVGYRQDRSQVSRSVGYGEAVRRAPEIVRAWSELRREVDARGEHEARTAPTRSPAGLSELLATMSFPAREYYRRLVGEGPGPSVVVG